MRNIILKAAIILAAGAAAFGADANPGTIIPQPQKVETRAGAFTITADTAIVTDPAARASGQYLASRLAQSTGFQLKVGDATGTAATPHRITLSIVGSDAAGARAANEGYELNVTPEAVTIRAADPAGAFYGVQSLLQLLPPQVFGAKLVVGVAWTVPCVHIIDQPRFKWRGVLLDVSRHFFNKAEVERVLDLMAVHKLNVLHWHLTDHDGWRIEIKKYPKLTEVGAWRNAINYGIDPRASTAYGADGRYGGFYTQEEIREVVQYARARHITVMPEIEMPGHAGAALTAYPQFNCVEAAGKGPARGLGVYCPGNDETFAFLQDVITEVFELFPDQYVHIGGDEVVKDNWAQCPKCQARMKQEHLQSEHELQSYFIRRMETFINAQKRTLVGWSEIRQGGLAPNAVMMDWIGGGLESAREGHDVVMTPGDYCYIDHYQSMDYAMQPVAIACYLPLRQAYAFEPIPEGLEAKDQAHILGAQANMWTELVASPRYLDYMMFPRVCALAEVMWSPKEARNWDDFQRRLQTHERRLDQLGVNYFSDRAVQIGEWKPGQIAAAEATLEWDASAAFAAGPGKYHVVFDYARGAPVKIAWVALLEDGREIARDSHPGLAAPGARELETRDVVYILGVPAIKHAAKYTIQAHVTGGPDSGGIVTLEAAVRRPQP